MALAGAVKVGGRGIIASGVVISRDGEPVELIIQNLVILINFATEAGAKPKFHRVGDDNRQTVTLTNFNNPLGTAFRDEVADLNGKPVFLSLYVHAVPLEPAAIRSIAYTLSSEGA